MLPPIFDTEKYNVKKKTEINKVFVYLPSRMLKHVVDMVVEASGFRGKTVVIYTDQKFEKDNHTYTSFGRKTIIEVHSIKDEEAFERDLTSSRYIVCEPEFDLVSSAINMGINVSIIHRPKDPYQVISKMKLETLNLAKCFKSLERFKEKSSDALTNWNDNRSFKYPNVAAHLVKKILEKEELDRAELARELWAEYEVDNEEANRLKSKGIEERNLRGVIGSMGPRGARGTVGNSEVYFDAQSYEFKKKEKKSIEAFWTPYTPEKRNDDDDPLAGLFNEYGSHYE